MHDFGYRGKPLPELTGRRPEMVRLDVGLSGGSVPKRLDQDVGVGILDAPVPLEDDVARLGSAGRGELLDKIDPVVGKFGRTGFLTTMKITR